MKTLIINLTTGETSTRAIEDPLAGGRYLSGQLVSEFTDPLCDPFSPDNTLVFAAGVLSNTRTSTGSRLSVGCKSPLTKGN